MTTATPRYEGSARPEPSSVLALLDRAFGASAPAPAVVDGERAYSYAELRRASDAVAHELQSLHAIGRDDVVALTMRPSFAFVACVVGVLKSGAAYLPVDPDYPEERIAAIRGVARAKLELKSAPDLDAPVPAGWRPSRPDPRDAAYVICTSGSTGRPKGIVQTHRCLANFVAWQVEASGLGRGRRILQFAPLSFDVSVQEILHGLASGGCLFVSDPELRRDPAELTRYIAEQEIEVVDLPPSLVTLLLELPETIADAHSLVHLICAGEPLLLTPALRDLLERRPDLTLHNHYGPAETHMLASHRVSVPLGNLERRPPVGRPVWNMRAYVLDERGELVDDGEAGEVHIAGAGVARGYTDPALTSAAFLPDPFRPGERMFRTRDLGRIRPDGTLQLLGRMDEMLKVRGHRVEPHEVEARLAEHPEVAAAAVFLRRTAAARDELNAVVAGGDGVTADELRAHLARSLPGYMLPARWWRVQRLPLSPNGKTDRARLPGPGAVALASRGASAEPLGPTETIVRDVFAQLLELDDIGADQDLFDLGCDSLTAARGLLRIVARTAADLRLRDLYEAPTVSGLAARIDALDARAPSIADEPPAGEPALSSCQRAIWLACQRSHEALLAYAFAELVSVAAGVTPAAIHAALAHVVASHDILRTAYPERRGEPVQLVRDGAEVRLDIVTTATGEALDRARGEAARALARPFRLATEPPLRALLVRATDASVLVLAFHHIASDAWSVDVVVDELNAALAGAESPPVRVQYARFARWQRRWLAGDEVRERVRERAAELAGARPTRLPAGTGDGRDAPAHPTFEIDIRAARELADERRDSVATILTAVFALRLSALTATADVLFGTTVAGRALAGLESAVGPYADIALLRLHVDSDAPFEDLLAATRRARLCADADQMLPYVSLAEAVPGLGSGRAHVLPSVGLQLLPAPRTPRAAAPLRRVETVWPQAARFELWLAGVEAGVVARFTIEHGAGRGAQAHDFMTGFEASVAACVARPDRPVGELVPGAGEPGALFGLRL